MGSRYLFNGDKRMTLITVQNGKVVLRDGKIGTEQACCCGGPPCDCESCYLDIQVNGVSIPENPNRSPGECGENPSNGYDNGFCDAFTPYGTVVCTGSNVDTGNCVGERGPPSPGYCDVQAAYCLIECSDTTQTIRLFLYVFNSYQCWGTADPNGNNLPNGLVFAGVALYFKDYTFSLPPCGETGDVGEPEEGSEVEISACDDCNAFFDINGCDVDAGGSDSAGVEGFTCCSVSVTVTCNAFP